MSDPQFSGENFPICEFNLVKPEITRTKWHILREMNAGKIESRLPESEIAREAIKKSRTSERRGNSKSYLEETKAKNPLI